MHWSRSKSIARAELVRCRIGGVSQIKLSNGFSMEKSPPVKKTTRANSTERARNMLPRNTKAALSSDRCPSPIGWSLERNGGGPLSSFRAELKVVHGVPRCTKSNRPA